MIFVVGIVRRARDPACEAGRAARDRGADRERSHAPSIVAAGTAMGLMRGVVGFFTFFAAFVLKKQGEPAWMFGLVLIVERDRQRDRNVIAPLLRQKVREEWILAGSLVVPAIPLVFAARSYGRLSLVFAAIRRSRRIGAALASRSTACCSATARTRRAGARSRGSRRDSSSSGCSAASSRCLLRWRPRRDLPVALVLLFAGLSYVGAVAPPGPEKYRRPNRRAPG